jgi:hypothetical protein
LERCLNQRSYVSFNCGIVTTQNKQISRQKLAHAQAQAFVDLPLERHALVDIPTLSCFDYLARLIVGGWVRSRTVGARDIAAAVACRNYGADEGEAVGVGGGDGIINDGGGRGALTSMGYPGRNPTSRGKGVKEGATAFRQRRGAGVTPDSRHRRLGEEVGSRGFFLEPQARWALVLGSLILAPRETKCEAKEPPSPPSTFPLLYREDVGFYIISTD